MGVASTDRNKQLTNAWSKFQKRVASIRSKTYALLDSVDTQKRQEELSSLRKKLNRS